MQWDDNHDYEYEIKKTKMLENLVGSLTVLGNL